MDDIIEHISKQGEYCFLEADLRQAEARVVALLSNNEDILRLFDITDMHKFTDSNVLGVPFDGITDPMRFIGKECRHAGNLGVKKRRFMLMVNTDAKKFHIDLSISEWKAGQLLEAFHAFDPSIRGVFHAGIEKALRDNNRTLISPNGRRRQFLGRWEGNFLEETYAQIPQSTVGDQTKLAALNFRRRLPHIPIIVEAHDALVTMPRVSERLEAAQILKEELEKPIDFTRCSLQRRPLIIPAEVKIAYDNYRNFKEFEF
jgi:DNA polymerase I-like protein with 3'-5' exonuclease and polymerase domains